MKSGPKEDQVRALKLAKHHEMIVEEGAPVELCRPAGQKKAEAATQAFAEVETRTAPRLSPDERAIRDEAEARWRDWTVSAKERTRPRLATFVRRVRERRRRAAAAEAKKPPGRLPQAVDQALAAAQGRSVDVALLGSVESVFRAKKPKAHDADDGFPIEEAVGFAVSLFHDGAHERHETSTLAAARMKGLDMEEATGNKRRSLVYAIAKDGRSFVVPRDHTAPAQPQETTMKTPSKKTPKTKTKAAPKKPPSKIVEGKKAAKPPARAAGKSDVVHKMLTSENGATRAELSKATGWPYVNLKTAAERAKMTLVEQADRFRLVAKAS